jgi:Peptidase family M41
MFGSAQRIQRCLFDDGPRGSLMNYTEKQIADGERGIGVAYHEAGHAVIGRVLGLLCGEVTIIPSRTALGGAVVRQIPPRDQPMPHGLLVCYVKQLMAGREAEKVCWTVLDECGDENDRAMIDELRINSEHYGDRPLYLGSLRGVTARLVRQHKRSIEAVALTLIERQTMTSKEIVGAIGRSYGVHPDLMPFLSEFATGS